VSSILKLAGFQGALLQARQREGLVEREPEPEVSKPVKQPKFKVPMKWPEKSLVARQTMILEWILFNGGRVDFRSEEEANANPVE